MPRADVAYGADPDQVASLHAPEGEGPWPAVVLIHGGFWRKRWDRATTMPLADDLAARGFAAWHIEYRRPVWPATLDDVAAAIDGLAGIDGIDTDRVATVGHSAGGQLALWAAGRRRARVRIRAAVSLAGVVDLVACADENLGDGACRAFLGGSPAEVPERYAEASPIERLPIGVPQLLVHGTEDDIVPVRLSRDYAAAAREAGDEVALVELSGVGHFEVIEPDHTAWLEVVRRLPALLG